MNTREFNAQHRALTDKICQLSDERAALVKAFKQDCKHPTNKLTMDTNWYEDEYGKTMESWTDYEYKCTRCNTVLYKVKKKFIGILSLRQALKDANK